MAFWSFRSNLVTAEEETEAQRKRRTCSRPTSGIEETLTWASKSSKLSSVFFFLWLPLSWEQTWGKSLPLYSISRSQKTLQPPARDQLGLGSLLHPQVYRGMPFPHSTFLLAWAEFRKQLKPNWGIEQEWAFFDFGLGLFLIFLLYWNIVDLKRVSFRYTAKWFSCTYTCICKCVYLQAKLLQSCPTLCDHMDCSPPGSSVHGILLLRILEWVAMTSSRVSYVSCTGRWILYHWATWEAQHIYLFFIKFFSHLGYHRELSRVPCAKQPLKLLADL